MGSTAARRIGVPRAVRVRTGNEGRPRAIGRERVEAIREDWVVEDRWWTGGGLRRRYYELVLEDGRNAVVFRDLIGGGWFVQRG